MHTKVHPLGSRSLPSRQRVVESEEAPVVIKRLFYAVLAFWLVKKYVLPFFEPKSDDTPAGEL